MFGSIIHGKFSGIRISIIAMLIIVISVISGMFGIISSSGISVSVSFTFIFIYYEPNNTQ